jgi:ABC-type sugar transport system ATPase subunit
VSIRPEHIEIRADSSSTPQPNVVDGEVGARLFTGESMQYQVNLTHGRLTCRTSAEQRLSTGKPVSLHLPAARCTALPRHERTDA